MKEIWQDIPGYEGIYQASTFGRIKSLNRYRKGKRGSQTFVKGRIMRMTKSKSGYQQVGLSKNLEYKYYFVHRLVAITFIDNPTNAKCVDHINGKRDDNRLENLRWCTIKENLNYPLARKNIAKANRNSTKCAKHIRNLHEAMKKPIVIVYPSGKVKEYQSAIEAEKDGFYHPLIAACCKGKQKTHRKCKCYYKEDYYGN